MKKITFIAVVAALMLIGGQAQADPTGLPFTWGGEVNAGACPEGELVINVTHKVVNDRDSAVDNSFWAYDKYNKHIQVWQVDDDTFCAVAQYVGSITTVAGSSPNNTGCVTDGIKGTMQGGYRATITGSLKSNPNYKTRGNIGKFDYGWNGDRNTEAPNKFNWVNAYFSTGWGFSYDWWGWIYNAGKNGTWINATGGNQGDITSNNCP
jgi:hypothetical protein